MKNYYAEGHSKHVHLNTTDSNIIDYKVPFISHLLTGKHNYFLFQPCRLSTQLAASRSDHTLTHTPPLLYASPRLLIRISVAFFHQVSHHLTLILLFLPLSSLHLSSRKVYKVVTLIGSQTCPYLHMRILCETCHSVLTDPVNPDRKN